MSESYVEVREDGSVRLAGTLAYPEATVADVLTVQADGSIAAAAGGGSSTSLTATSTGDPADYTSVIDVKAADATQVVACDTGGEFDVATTSVLGGYIQIRDSDTGRVAKISPSGSMIDVESGAAIDLEGFGSPVVRIEGHNTGAAGRLGFFGATPIAPPAAPVTLEDVIAALQALGLVAT